MGRCPHPKASFNLTSWTPNNQNQKTRQAIQRGKAWEENEFLLGVCHRRPLPIDHGDDERIKFRQELGWNKFVELAEAGCIEKIVDGEKGRKPRFTIRRAIRLLVLALQDQPMNRLMSFGIRVRMRL